MAPRRPTTLPDALLLTCFDYRLPRLVARYMRARGLAGRYDHVALAGASLAVTHPALRTWGTTFLEQVQVAVDLHGVTRLLLLDHRDCGAYRVYLGLDQAIEPANETEVHATHLKAAGQVLADRWPHLQVELLLMDMSGQVELVS